ncbi:MAG: hypothetical protein IPI35_09535 [Deltaproteobacteria bacterium]|nr:hypothetical protein [Deltaproteobacteria bacterium]
MRIRAALAELPTALAVLGAWALLWRDGRAFVLDEQLGGYRWPDYLFNAWMVGLGEAERYDSFRRPLHGFLVSVTGGWLGSVPNAAILWGGLSMAAVALSAGVLGRALGGRFAGALAALLVASVAPNLEAARAGNLYPLLAATSALALASAAALARWPSLPLAALTGALAGVSYATDDRGVMMLPGCVGLVLLGAWRAEGLPKKLGVAALALALALPIGQRLKTGFGQLPFKELSVEQKRVIQQDVVARYIQNSRDPELISTCASVPNTRLLTAEFVRDPCAAATLKHNLTDPMRRHLPLGLTLGLGLLPLALLPAGRRLGGVFEGLCGVIVPALGFGALLLFTPMPDRYLLQLSVLAAAGPAIGLARLMEGLGATLRALIGERLPPWIGEALGAVSLVGLGLWAAQADPADRHSPSATQLDAAYTSWNQAAKAARAVVQPGDTLLDCAGHSVNIALLPQVTWTGPLANLWQDTVQDDVVALCEPYLLAPPAGDGARWAVVAARRPDSPDPKAQQNFTRLWSLVNQPTWEIVWRNDRAVLAKAR